MAAASTILRRLRRTRRSYFDRRQWARSLAGVTISEVGGGEVRLVLNAAIDSNVVLGAAMLAGRVTKFSFERRRLSEVFREALT
jgi:hypothetical protein